MHKIRTLFWSRNIKRLARWCRLPWLRASLLRSAIKLDFSISHDRNSVLILCLIVVAVFFFFFWLGSSSMHVHASWLGGRKTVGPCVGASWAWQAEKEGDWRRKKMAVLLVGQVAIFRRRLNFGWLWRKLLNCVWFAFLCSPVYLDSGFHFFWFTAAVFLRNWKREICSWLG